jgi:hypothetical protein
MHQLSITINKYFVNWEINAPGLASLKRARTVVRALWKIFTDLLVGFGRLLLLHLGLLFWILGNCYRGHFLRSCMVQIYKCSCLGAL